VIKPESEFGGFGRATGHGRHDIRNGTSFKQTLPDA
jgi:hypothetical protein